jgi:DNA-binding IclR family transcriptional regulator
MVVPQYGHTICNALVDYPLEWLDASTVIAKECRHGAQKWFHIVDNPGTMTNVNSTARTRPVAAAKPSGTQTIQRASLLVRLIASRSRTGMRLAEVVQHSKLERPTAHRMLKCLVEEGFLMQSADSHEYFLGPLIFELGLAASPQFNLPDACRESMERIAGKSGDTVFLSVRSGYDSVCIDRKEGAYPIKALTLEVGTRRPLGVGAGGLALLLRLTDEAVEEIIRANAKRLAAYHKLTMPLLQKTLQRSRKLGYALNDSHIIPGATTLGLPIVNRYGHPFASISMAAISSRMTPPRQAELVAMLAEEIAIIERAMRDRILP